MLKRGQNERAFRSTQVAFAAHIRHPDLHPIPAGIEPRRMKIYADLFFNNIKNFLSTTFPIAQGVLGQPAWLALCREFFHEHASASPYFAEISQEFLTFLDARRQRPDCEDPVFLLELCHYEWVEVSLDLEIDEEGEIPQGDAVFGDVRLSSEARCLQYTYPVHLIGAEHRPEQPAATQLVVYRYEDKVHFMETNLPTLRMLSLLGTLKGDEAIAKVASELDQAQPGSTNTLEVIAQGSAQLRKFAELGILRCRV